MKITLVDVSNSSLERHRSVERVGAQYEDHYSTLSFKMKMDIHDENMQAYDENLEDWRETWKTLKRGDA